jgi:hypothetical protein
MVSNDPTVPFPFLGRSSGFREGFKIEPDATAIIPEVQAESFAGVLGW